MEGLKAAGVEAELFRVPETLPAEVRRTCIDIVEGWMGWR
jgi:hypothetical protein